MDAQEAVLRAQIPEAERDKARAEFLADARRRLRTDGDAWVREMLTGEGRGAVLFPDRPRSHPFGVVIPEDKP